MAVLSTLTFLGIHGFIIPAGTETVDDVDNPEQADAAVRVKLAQRSTLTFGPDFFAASQRNAIYALVGQVVDASDEASDTPRPVLVCRVVSYEEPPGYDVDGVTFGKIVTAAVEVRDWPA